MQFLNSIKSVVQNYKPYDKWEQDQADERAKKEYLAANTEIPKDKLDLVTAKAQAVVRAAEIMDAKSEDNCENMEQFTEMAATAPILAIQILQFPFLKKYANNLKKTTMVQGIGLGISFLMGIGLVLWGNSKQKEASRIGRFQAKRDNLQGDENFVTYTPEQIKKAEEIAKNLPNEKESNGIIKILRELRQLFKDQKAYKEWLSKQDPQEIEKLKNLNFSPEQLQKGKENQELIIDTVKEINIKAEEYSENLENAFETFGMIGFLATAPAMFVLNKILNKTNLKNPITRKMLSIVIPPALMLSVAMYGTVEQKKSARIGRYYARKDLLKNPARLLAFSDEEMEKAKDIKADDQKVGFFKKIGQNFKFLWDYFKLKREYNKYRKTEKQNNEKLQKAFKQIEITDTQKAEAQELKENVFRAFDEIDEMSQRYSEDVEAGCEIARQTVNSGVNLAWLGSLLGLLYLGSKGKLPYTKLINGITKMAFKKDSVIRESVNTIHTAAQGKNMNDVMMVISGKKEINSVFGANSAQVSTSINNLCSSFNTIANNIMTGKSITESLKGQIKDGIIARYTSNLFKDIVKIFGKERVESMGIEIPKDVSEKLKLNVTYDNYKTLFNTVIATFAPIMALVIGIPFAINSWFTNIQKKAGKIGIMKAMENIDDPRVFAPQKDQAETTQGNMQETNLLKKFLNKKMAA